MAAKQVMDSRASKGLASGISNEQLRKWTDKGWENAQLEHNYDRSRAGLNFEIGKGGVVQPIDKHYSLEQRMRDNLKERGIIDPNEGLKEPRFRTIEHFIFGGSTERMRELAFGNQTVDFENHGVNGGVKRMPDIENWAKDIYCFICEKFGEKNVIGFIVHLDETNPHIHCTLMPITEDDKFSYKKIFGGATKFEFKRKYLDLHDELAKVNEKWGLSRGDSISVTKAKHRPTEEYRKWLSTECSSLEEKRENLQKAISDIQIEIAIAERKQKSFSTMISNLENEKEALEKEIDELREQVNMSQKERDEKLSELRNKLTTVEEKLDWRESQLADAERQLSVLRYDYDETQKAYVEMSQAKEDLSKKVLDSKLNYGQNMAYHLYTEAFQQVMRDFIPVFNKLPEEGKAMFDGTLISELAEKGSSIVNLGVILMCDTIDSATTFAESHGGGGGGGGDDFKRDDDDDDRKWAARCLAMARQMMRPAAGRKRR